MVDLIAVHGEMTRDGFQVTWDLEGDLRAEARSDATLIATVHHPWGRSTELMLVITPITTAQFVSGGLGGLDDRLADQRVATASVDAYSVETVFPARWLDGYRNEVAIEATLTVDGGLARTTSGVGFAASVAA